MTERRFEISREGYTLTCSNCGTIEYAGRSSKGGNHLPPDAITKFFRNKGWKVGSTAKKDLCPGCAVPVRRTVTKELTMPHDTKVIEIKPKVTGVSEMPPREMTREDRRIIFAQLEEVYVDEATGYLTDWNDERVSKHLNCPRKWIETIREENFGPAHAPESPQIIALREKIDSTIGTITNVTNETADFKQRVSAMVTEAITLNTRANSVLTQAQNLREELKKLTGR